METFQSVCIKGLSDISGLCRVCLTQSKQMIYLESKFKLSANKDLLVSEVLRQVMSVRTHEDNRYPSFVCPMCMGILNITYKFRLQFEQSQHLLRQYFGQSLIKTAIAPVPSVDKSVDEENSACVEIISNFGKYDLNDLIIVEDAEEEKETFDGFLKNLGKEVSVKFASNNGHKEKEMVPENDVTSKTSNVEQRVCSICQKVFTGKNYLHLHMKTHDPKTQVYFCKLCGYKARSRSGLFYHTTKHSEKKFQCNNCGKRYYCNNTLKEHMRGHTNERLHLCSICGKSYNFLSTLRYHMNIHAGKKKFKCDYCDRRFLMLSGWKRHIRIHTGARPFRCSFCEKAFMSKGEVACHEMAHTGYRPYQCKNCGKGFKKKYNLQVHFRGRSGRTCEMASRLAKGDIRSLITHGETEEHVLNFNNIHVEGGENVNTSLEC